MPVRETPWREGFARTLTRMDEEFEELMERLFHPEEGRTPESGWFTPRIDFTETEAQYEVKVDLPGLKPEEVKVELRNGDLWISGQRKEEKEEEGKTYHRIERRHGEFRRVLPLPVEVAEEKIEARVENGVLTVNVPKTETVRPKTIEVKT
jgi:HSP20 family protein